MTKICFPAYRSAANASSRSMLILLLWCSCLNVFPQVNTGPWKIGVSTVNDLKKYAADRTLTVKESWNSRDIKINQEKNSLQTSAILEVFVDTANGGENWIYSHWGFGKLCLNVRTFWMDCAVVGNIQMKNIYLYFFNDTLYNFSLNNPEMSVLDELKNKNAGWKVRKKSEIAYCGNQNPGDTLYAQHVITAWIKAGTQLKAEFETEDGYDIESCEKEIYTSFEVKNDSIDKYVWKCDRAANDAWNAAQKK